VALNVREVVFCEQRGLAPAKDCVSERFFMHHLAPRSEHYIAGSRKVIDVSELYGLRTVVESDDQAERVWIVSDGSN
jgi:hypothetical protein